VGPFGGDDEHVVDAACGDVAEEPLEGGRLVGASALMTSS
jgi:hypothetical protein